MEVPSVRGASSSSSTWEREREVGSDRAELCEPVAAENKGPAKNMERQMKELEVSLAELNALQSTRRVYVRRGSVLFLTNKKAAIGQQQKELDRTRKQLAKLQGGTRSS